jgi:hypothetical protein
MLTTELQLMDVQVQTLFCHDENGRIRYVNEPGQSPPAPRFFLGQTKHGNIWRFRYNLPEDVVCQLNDLASSEPITADLRGKPIHFEYFRNVLQAHSAIQQVWIGPAYRFPDDLKPSKNVTRINRANAELLRSGFASQIPELEAIQPCVAVMKQGQAVSVCCSSRVSPQAAEAGIKTLKDFRRRGYAIEAVAGWAVAVRELGRIPLYSTSWNNVASQGVARKLGLVLYGVDLHFT